MTRKDSIQEVPAGYGSQIFKIGMELYKRQSLPLFLLSFGAIVFSCLSFVMPKVLGLIICFLTPVVSIGVLRCIRFLDEATTPVTPKETFPYFYDDSRRQDYLPLCLISLIMPVLQFFSSSAPGLGMMVSLLIQLIIEVMFFYGLPLVEFNRLPAKEALLLSLDATAKNWKSLTVYGLLFIVFSVISTMTLGIGFLFFVPISTAARYYFWKVTFDSNRTTSTGEQAAGHTNERDVTPTL